MASTSAAVHGPVSSTSDRSCHTGRATLAHVRGVPRGPTVGRTIGRCRASGSSDHLPSDDVLAVDPGRRSSTVVSGPRCGEQRPVQAHGQRSHCHREAAEDSHIDERRVGCRRSTRKPARTSSTTPAVRSDRRGRAGSCAVSTARRVATVTTSPTTNTASNSGKNCSLLQAAAGTKVPRGEDDRHRVRGGRAVSPGLPGSAERGHDQRDRTGGRDSRRHANIRTIGH